MGLGYIGLPTAIISAKHGVDVVGVDINPRVVDVTNQGKLHIIEPGMEEITPFFFWHTNLTNEKKG